MSNTNYLTLPKTEVVVRWLGYISWVGGAIFFGALSTTRDCQHSEHIASTWGGFVVLMMISTYGVRVRCAPQIPTRSRSNVAGELVPKLLSRRLITPALRSFCASSGSQWLRLSAAAWGRLFPLSRLAQNTRRVFVAPRPTGA
jgi:hypothetical protein